MYDAGLLLINIYYILHHFCLELYIYLEKICYDNIQLITLMKIDMTMRVSQVIGHLTSI